MKRYIIYNSETGEEYVTGYNEFAAMNNLATYRKHYGDVIKIKWVWNKSFIIILNKE